MAPFLASQGYGTHVQRLVFYAHLYPHTYMGPPSFARVAEKVFMRQLSLEHLLTHIRTAQLMLDWVGGLPRPSLFSAMKTINKIDLGLVSSKNLTVRTDELAVLVATENLAASAAVNICTGNLFRQRVMLTDHHFGSTLSTSLHSRCKRVSAAMRGSQGEYSVRRRLCTDDLYRLVQKAYNTITLRQPILFSSQDFVPGVLPAIKVYKRNKLPDHIVGDDETDSAVADLVVAVIRHWFSRPSDRGQVTRNELVQAVLDVLGPGALLLPCMWDLFNNPPKWICDPHRQEGVSSRFLSILRSLYASDAHTVEYKTLYALKERFRDILLRLQSHSETNRTTIEAVQAPPPPSLEHRPNSDAIAQAETALSIIPGPSVTDALSHHRQPIPDRSQWVVRVAGFLQSGYRVAMSSGDTEFSPLEEKIVENSDWLQPLRELTVSRCRLNGQPDQVLAVPEAATTKGIFTLLLFRNVLYHSPYLLSDDIPAGSRRMVFEDADDFRAHMDVIKNLLSLPTVDSFFCTGQAFSQQPMKGRTVRIVDRVYTAARDPQWSLLAQEGLPIPFTRALDLLARVAKGIPACGTLSQYLTLTDMHYAGVVTAPSIDETADMIWTLNKGGISGLVCTHYLEASGSSKARATREEVRTAFAGFYRDVANSLGAEDVLKLGWNTIVAEHTLCKIMQFRDSLMSFG